MNGKIRKLEDRIDNLKDILNLTIRYEEWDIRREVDYQIRQLERELRIYKNRWKW